MKQNIWYALTAICLLVTVYAIMGLVQSASMSETPNGHGSASSFQFWLIVTVVAAGATLTGMYTIYKSRPKT